MIAEKARDINQLNRNLAVYNQLKTHYSPEHPIIKLAESLIQQASARIIINSSPVNLTQPTLPNLSHFLTAELPLLVSQLKFPVGVISAARSLAKIISSEVIPEKIRMNCITNFALTRRCIETQEAENLFKAPYTVKLRDFIGLSTLSWNYFRTLDHYKDQLIGLGVDDLTPAFINNFLGIEVVVRDTQELLLVLGRLDIFEVLREPKAVIRERI